MAIGIKTPGNTMEFIVLWLGLAIIAGIVGASKGRSGLGWFLLGLLISGLLAVILVALLPSLKPSVVHVAGAGPEIRPEDAKICPRCAETVRRAAKVCRYCSYEFSEGEMRIATQVPFYDDDVYVKPFKPALSSRTEYFAHIHGTKRRFDTEEEAVEHIRKFRDQRRIS